MIYTSYFGKMKSFPPNFEPICIARWKPKWYNGKVLLLLAPSPSLLKWWRASKKGKEEEEQYKKIYSHTALSDSQAPAMERLIYYIAGDKIPVLVCFEKEGFCHRHIIKEWLNKNGIECEEWNGK